MVFLEEYYQGGSLQDWMGIDRFLNEFVPPGIWRCSIELAVCRKSMLQISNSALVPGQKFYGVVKFDAYILLVNQTH